MSRVCSISARLGYAAPEKVSSYIVSIIHSSKKIPRGLLVVDLFFFVIGRYAYLVFSVGCASSIKARTKKEKEKGKKEIWCKYVFSPSFIMCLVPIRFVIEHFLLFIFPHLLRFGYKPLHMRDRITCQ